MVLEPVLCPACGTDNVVKHGRSKVGKQRYKCRNSECNRSTFMRDYIDRGYLPDVKQQIVDIAIALVCFTENWKTRSLNCIKLLI